jgi:hypothetical protein
VLIGLLALPSFPAWAGGTNANHLVPAFVVCPGPDTCGAPQRESSFTFESAVLKAPRGKFTNPNKPAFVVELKGVKDASGAPVTSTDFTVRIAGGQVNISSLALTIPAGHVLSAIAPIPIPLKNGNGSLAYKPTAEPPPGTVSEGGGVTIYDSQGKRLATTGAQYR